jgi:hypothetical protein
MIENAAVFISGSRRFRGVNVEVIDGEVLVKNRVNGAIMSRYPVVEVAKEGMAWDITDDATNDLARLVAQQGCGCSGMKRYENDPTYTGPFPGRN